MGRCISRTFPRIGKIRESTPFQRGMNCMAVSDLYGRKTHQYLQLYVIPQKNLTADAHS